VITKLLERFDELWKRFDAIEAEAKRYSQTEGNRIIEVVERAKLELLKQLQALVQNARETQEEKKDEHAAE
jgi:hypothetical protein